MNEIPKLKSGSTRVRWACGIKAEALNSLRTLCSQTRTEHFLEVPENCGVSTNLYLRRIHCLAPDMNWLPWPVAAANSRWSGEAWCRCGKFRSQNIDFLDIWRFRQQILPLRHQCCRDRT